MGGRVQGGVGVVEGFFIVPGGGDDRRVVVNGLVGEVSVL